MRMKVQKKHLRRVPWSRPAAIADVSVGKRFKLVRDSEIVYEVVGYEHDRQVVHYRQLCGPGKGSVYSVPAEKEVWT